MLCYVMSRVSSFGPVVMAMAMVREFFFPTRVNNTSHPKKTKLPRWIRPTPRRPEGAQRLLESLTPVNSKSMFLSSPLLDSLQEGFCPPGWPTSKFSVMGANGHFCVHFTPGSKVATMLPCCLFLVQECSKFRGSAGV